MYVCIQSAPGLCHKSNTFSTLLQHSDISLYIYIYIGGHTPTDNNQSDHVYVDKSDCNHCLCCSLRTQSN